MRLPLKRRKKPQVSRLCEAAKAPDVHDFRREKLRDDLSYSATHPRQTRVEHPQNQDKKQISRPDFVSARRALMKT